LLAIFVVVIAKVWDGSLVDNEQRMIRLAVVDLSWNISDRLIQVQRLA
jgi:hypothetical protein